MAKTKVSEWDSTPGNNTDIDSINIAEGCAPSGINNAIRELMSQVKDFQQGTYSDPFNGPVNGTIGATTPAAGAFTTLSASGAVTLSGGTANGVAYLNGSKVLTSGSALTFDGSNLGLGVTPSAWFANSKVFQFGTGGSIEGRDNNPLAAFASNSYIDTTGNYKYLTTANATRYYQTNGQHIWQVAPSGTAGNAISFTQAMTLDASGNLLVGATSGSGKLQVKTTGGQWRIEPSSTGTKMVGLNAADSGEDIIGIQGNPVVFITQGNERARIDSSGNLLINTTSPLNNGKLSVNQTNASYDAVVSVVASTSQSFYAGIYGGNFKYYVLGSGQINAIYTSITAISDRRAKTNIQDISYGLNEVLALRPVTFDHIDSVAEDSVDNYGFIADEVEQILPELVSESLNKADDGTPYQTLKMGDMLPVLVKAIQEQQAIINAQQAALDSIKARLDAANL